LGVILGHAKREREREREEKFITTKQIIDVTIKINLCGRQPGRKFPPG